MKPHGDATLPDDKRYFNYRHSRARLVTEKAFEGLKSRFRAQFRKCESDKETVKLYGLACIVLHNLCIDRDDLVSRKFDLTSDHTSNKRLRPEEVRDALALRTGNNLPNQLLNSLSFWKCLIPDDVFTFITAFLQILMQR